VPILYLLAASVAATAHEELRKVTRGARGNGRRFATFVDARRRTAGGDRRAHAGLSFDGESELASRCCQ
jgi:hypothetical protein